MFFRLRKIPKIPITNSAAATVKVMFKSDHFDPQTSFSLFPLAAWVGS